VRLEGTNESITSALNSNLCHYIRRQKINRTMSKFTTQVSTGVLETKKCVVYASSESEAQSKIESAGYRAAYAITNASDLLNGYIDSKERAGELIVIR